MSQDSKYNFDDSLVKLAQNIYRDDDINALGKALGFGEGEIGRCMDANERQRGTYMGTLEMLRKWRKKQKVAEELDALKTAVEKAGFQNLIDECLSTKEAGTEQPGHVPAASVLPSSERQEEYKEVQPDDNGYYKQRMKAANPTEDQRDPDKCYKMDESSKGLMFIMNITEDRMGSEVDVKNITHVFSEIGYDIELHQDLTTERLMESLDAFVKSPRNEGKCSVVFLFMAHGDETGILCFDGKILTTKRIEEKIYEMESMVGKPKLIFYQRCRKVKSRHLKTDESKPPLAATAESDVLIVNATIDGRVAYRDEDKGSWFIQMLCEVLLERAHEDDLYTMLLWVTRKVEELAYENSCHQFISKLLQGNTKKLYFLPKYPTK